MQLNFSKTLATNSTGEPYWAVGSLRSCEHADRVDSYLDVVGATTPRGGSAGATLGRDPEQPLCSVEQGVSVSVATHDRQIPGKQADSSRGLTLARLSFLPQLVRSRASPWRCQSYATSLRTCRARTSLMRVWYPTRRRCASLRNPSSTPGLTRIAISWRGSSPSGGRPTRRIALSCAADESAISEKSIFRRVRRTLAAARPPRADDPDRFRIAPSPERVRDHEHVSACRSTKAQEPRLRRRVLQVRAIERLGIQEDGHGLVEGDAVLRRVGLSLPRVPREHLFSIYEIPGPAGPSGAYQSTRSRTP